MQPDFRRTARRIWLSPGRGAHLGTATTIGHVPELTLWGTPAERSGVGALAKHSQRNQPPSLKAIAGSSLSSLRFAPALHKNSAPATSPMLAGTLRGSAKSQGGHGVLANLGAEVLSWTHGTSFGPKGFAGTCAASVSRSRHFLISACPSAKEKPHAPLW